MFLFEVLEVFIIVMIQKMVFQSPFFAQYGSFVDILLLPHEMLSEVRVRVSQPLMPRKCNGVTLNHS